MTQRTGIGGPPISGGRREIEPGDVGDELQVGDRKMRRVDMREESSKAFEGMVSPEGHPYNPMNPPPPGIDPEGKKEVDRMMPEFLKQEQQREGEKEQRGEHDDLVAILGDKIIEARRDGDDELAGKLNEVLGSALGDLQPKRVREPKPIHPALEKLRRNLGLKKIKPVEIEWCGTKWHFRTTPAAVDRWVAQMNAQGLGQFSALKLAGACVGMDDVPIYEVFGIDIEAAWEPPGGGEPVTVQLYEKRCDACGELIPVNTTLCDCGSKHDPFDMPLALRLRCVDLLHQQFAEDFGPYEELSDLYHLMRDELPDRAADRKQLYPFPELWPTSSEETKQDTNPSGEKQ